MAALHMIGPSEIGPSEIGPSEVGRSDATHSGSDGTTRAKAAASWWTAWGGVVQVAVTDRSALRAARRIVERELADTERAAFRYRPDAEIHRLYRAGGRSVLVSPLLAELISAALITAERTGGDVDPTVAAAVTRLNLDDASPGGRVRALPSCGRGPVDPGTRSRIRPVAGWESVRLDGRHLQVPAGVTLDLTATAKALSCDRAAFRVADRLGVGVSVALGGNVATAGQAPDGGWTVHLQDRDQDRDTGSGEACGTGLRTTVVLPAGTALATSDLIGMVDPRTGAAVAGGDEAVWRSASAIAFSCLEATSYTAASLVRGPGARSWLTGLGVPARLLTIHDGVIEVAGWADHVLTPTPGSSDESLSLTSIPAPRRTDPPQITDSQRTTLR